MLGRGRERIKTGKGRGKGKLEEERERGKEGGERGGKGRVFAPANMKIVPTPLLETSATCILTRDIDMRYQINVCLCSAGIVSTRSSADADNRLDAFSRQSRSTNMVPFLLYVTYSFLLCNSNFVFKTRRFYDIRLQKIS